MYAHFKQVCVQPPTYADKVALPSLVRRTPLLLSAGRAAIDRYLLPAEPTAANLQQWVCCCGPMMGQRHGGIPCRYTDAPHTMPALPRIRAIVSPRLWNFWATSPARSAWMRFFATHVTRSVVDVSVCVVYGCVLGSRVSCEKRTSRSKYRLRQTPIGPSNLESLPELAILWRRLACEQTRMNAKVNAILSREMTLDTC